MATPVFDGAELKGIVAGQLNIDDINKFMTSSGNWVQEGMGASGEVYLVGEDENLRTSSRFLIEDKEGYLQALRDAAVPSKAVRLIENTGVAILNQPVKSVASKKALRGISGTEIVKDYRNMDVLSAYGPIEIGGMRWAILAEKDVSEAMAPLHDMRNKLLITMGSIAILVTLFSLFAAGVFAKPVARELIDAFDEAAERHGVERINTVGDVYLAACGLPIPRLDHAKRSAALALEMISIVHRFNRTHNFRLTIGIGLSSGEVDAGIVGKRRFVYEILGESVTVARQMATETQINTASIAKSTYADLQDASSFKAAKPLKSEALGTIERCMAKVVLTAVAIFSINTLLTALNAFLISQRDKTTFLANIPGLLLDLLRLTLVLIGAAIIVSTVWGADLQGALVGLGVGGIVLGLALQDTLSAVFAGLSMVSTRNFKEGDWLKTGDFEGRVTAMDWRSVTIETEQKTLAVVPNSELALRLFTSILVCGAPRRSSSCWCTKPAFPDG